MESIGSSHNFAGHTDKGNKDKKRKPSHKGTKRAITRATLAVLVICSLVLAMIGVYTCEPDNAYAGDYVHYSSKDEVHYGEDGWFTHIMECDGAMAYCVQPRRVVPKDGDYRKEALAQTASSLENLRSLLWFGYGGPGFDESMWPGRYSDGTVMHSNLYYVLTHVILTNYYNADDASSSFKGLSEREKEWLTANIMPISDSSFGFSNGDGSTFVGRCFARRSEVPPTFECFSLNSGNATQTIVSFVATGDLNILKVSSNHSLSDFDPMYSTSGIIYDIFTDGSCTQYAGSLTLDATGASDTLVLSRGTYYAKERQESCVSSGYAHDPTIHQIEVVAGRTNTLRVTDPPQYAIPHILVSKVDAETDEAHPLGAATLEGALFQVDFYGGSFDDEASAQSSGSHLRSWVFSTDPNGDALFDEEHLVSGDAPYRNEAGQIVLPLGTVIIREICPPTGYLLDRDKVYIEKIVPSSTETLVDAFTPERHPDQVKRGDIEFVKTNAADMSRLSHVAFRLISQTTGESHVLVTDENGSFRSSASWNPHTANTNFNDDAEESEWIDDAGIWFGMKEDGSTCEPDDNLGALPYDIYTLEELRCTSNAACELIRIEDITIKRDKVCVDLGTIDDPLKQTQYIASRAYSESDLDKTFLKGERVKLIDSIDFTNLIPGNDYTLRTKLVYKENGEDVICAGAPVSSERRFTADSSNGKTAVEIELDTSALEFDSVVFFESLYVQDTLLAQDCSLDNPDQTLYLTEPRISTLAYDAADDDKIIAADRNSRIMDAISLTGLIAGSDYRCEGSLMMKQADEDGSTVAVPVCDSDGNAVTSIEEFIAESTEHSIQVSFTFDSLLLDPECDLVVFERLYQNESLICEHCEVDNEDQSVHLSRPHLESYAWDANSKTKASPIDSRIAIMDTVTFSNLSPDETYTLIGIVMDTETVRPFSNDRTVRDPLPQAPDDTPIDEAPESPVPEDPNIGSSSDTPTALEALGLLPDDLRSAPYKSVTEFSPERSDGEIEMRFEISDLDPDDAEDRNLVIFEYLIRNDEIIADHANIDDTDQMVSLQAPHIQTEAMSVIDDTHEIAALSERGITDTVLYDDLVPGQEYVLKGILMDKATGEPLKIEDRIMEAKTLFTPNTPTGHTEVNFTIDAQSLKDVDIVVFEELYKDDELVAEHSDIDDEKQSIHVRQIEGGSLPQTGEDGAGMWMWIIPLSVLAVMLPILRRMLSKRIAKHPYSKSDRLIDSLYRFP